MKGGYCEGKMVEYFESIITNGREPRDWGVSRTVRIPKVSKARVNELRPIALLNVECKLFMSVKKGKMVEPLRMNGLINELQIGFTGGRCIEDNLFMLRYVIEACKRDKKELIGGVCGF